MIKIGMKPHTLTRKESYDKYGDQVVAEAVTILGQLDKREVSNTANPKESLSVRSIFYTQETLQPGDKVNGLEVVAVLNEGKYELS